VPDNIVIIAASSKELSYYCQIQNSWAIVNFESGAENHFMVETDLSEFDLIVFAVNCYLQNQSSCFSYLIEFLKLQTLYFKMVKLIRMQTLLILRKMMIQLSL